MRENNCAVYGGTLENHVDFSLYGTFTFMLVQVFFGRFLREPNNPTITGREGFPFA